jgi:hypothetical protein
MHTDTGGSGACSGRRKEIQITEVALQKGTLQNKDLLKSSILGWWSVSRDRAPA